MSELVKITVISGRMRNDMDHGGCGENLAEEKSGSRELTHHSGATLMSTLLENHLISGNFCGGRGVCGRCRVQFLKAAPIPTSMERRAFSAEELRSGYRLACMVKPKNDCVIRLDLPNDPSIDIVTDVIGMSEKIDLCSQKKKDIIYPEISENMKMIAVDLGTTTIAMQLRDMKTGQTEDTYCVMNPQRSYGTDVLSRIQAANAGNAERLQSAVWEALQAGIEKMEQTLANGPSRSGGRICCMCIAGNTTMTHLLMGLSTKHLGSAPFEPETLDLLEGTWTKPQEQPQRQTQSLPGIPFYVLPGMSAFVGGDITAGLYQCRMLASQIDVLRQDTTAGQREAVLFIDLGTNGEMAITDGRRMIVTATAAGPAFEGGAGVAVQGSDMVAVTSALLKEHIIDETGLLAEPYFEQGIMLKDPAVFLTQKDIRDLQMAKAAVRAGVDILYKKLGCPKIVKVYLAGGFGYYLDVEAAVAIGLLPEKLRAAVTAAGNTSLAGAFSLGRDLYTGRVTKQMLEKQLCQIESINLAKEEAFDALYVSYMNFPETGNK